MKALALLSELPDKKTTSTIAVDTIDRWEQIHQYQN